MLPSQAICTMSGKRKRGPNWSENEKKVLVEEYKRRRHILRPKGTGSSTVMERETAWEEICAALRVASGPYVKRDVVDVRKKWDNLCFWAKKCIAEWKDKNSLDEGGIRSINGDNTPSVLALKILAIYQEDWSDLFPNAQVVDGGDVFFVIDNNSRQSQGELGEEATYKDGVQNISEPSDIYQELENGPDLEEIKTECHDNVQDEDNNERWRHNMVPDDDASFHPIPPPKPPPKLSLPPPPVSHHIFQQHRISPQTSSPSSPLENPAGLPRAHSPPPSSSHSLNLTSASHTTSANLHPSRQFPIAPSSASVHQHPPKRTLQPSQTSSLNKRSRYSQAAANDDALSDEDDYKDVEQLSKELLILRKEKLVIEKQKLEIEKEKLVIERDILDMQRERQWLQLESDRLANGHG